MCVELISYAPHLQISKHNFRVNNRIEPFICIPMQLLIQSNALIRERERLSMCEYLRLCVSQQHVV